MNVRVGYFLGNLPQHWLHAEPLHQVLPGEVILMSHRAQDQLSSHHLQTTVLDDDPGAYLTLNGTHLRTLRYLESAFDVVFFFDVFSTPPRSKTGGSWWVQLGHGVIVKDYYYRFGTERFAAAIEQYDAHAAMGPFTKEILLRRKFPAKKVVEIGVARTDLVTDSRPSLKERQEALCRVGLNPHLPTVVYMPTFYGITSVETIPAPLRDAIDGKANLIFRPHPETPAALTEPALESLQQVPHFYYSHPSSDPHLWNIKNTYEIGDLFIGDMSSAFFEASLTGRPMVFTTDQRYRKAYSKRMKRLFGSRSSELEIITGNDSDALAAAISNGISNGDSQGISEHLASRLFFQHTDGARAEIVQYIGEVSHPREAFRLTRGTRARLALSRLIDMGWSLLRRIRQALRSARTRRE